MAGVRYIRQNGQRFTISDTKFARQLRRIWRREERNARKLMQSDSHEVKSNKER
jgi:hypothetical protein